MIVPVQIKKIASQDLVLGDDEFVIKKILDPVHLEIASVKNAHQLQSQHVFTLDVLHEISQKII
jgi:hypothetical protein